MSHPPPPQPGLFLPFLLLLCIWFLAETIHQQGTKDSAGHKLHRHVRAVLCPKIQIMAILRGVSLILSRNIHAHSPIFGGWLPASLLELRRSNPAAAGIPTAQIYSFCREQSREGAGWCSCRREETRRAVPAGFKLVWLRLFLPLAGLVGEEGEVKGSNRSLGTRKSSSSKKDWILLAMGVENKYWVFYLRVSFQKSYCWDTSTSLSKSLLGW